MKNQFFERKIVFALVAVVMGLGFAKMGYGETVVSLVPTTDIISPAVGEQVTIDIRITGGEGVAGYGPFIVFDSNALKYIGATSGDYLPPGGVWISPGVGDDGNYEITLSIGDSTTSGKSVTFGEEEISIERLLFEMREPPPAFASPGAEYWAVSILASSPFGANAKTIPTDGDGTLATLTFEVVKAKPGTIALLWDNLSDTNDATLETTLQNSIITVHALETPETLPADVNNDGNVDILDLVFVASKFGQPVTDATKAADVNGDGAINILDLTRIVQQFGN